MVTYRELASDEYGVLAGHPFLEGKPLPDPEGSRIIVAEDGGKVVGFQMVIFVAHLEPIWVDPAYRSGWMAFRLFHGAKRLLDRFRISTFYCWSETPDVSDYLSRLGLKLLPYKTFIYTKD